MAEIAFTIAGWAIVAGTGVAYAAQIVPIVRSRSASGVNPWSIALNVLASVFLCINVLFTQYLDPRQFSPPGGVVPFMQVFVSVPIASALLACIGWFAYTRTWVHASGTCAAIGAITLIAYIALVTIDNEFVVMGADAFGLLAAATTGVVWLPQIYPLARWKEIGQLSLAFLGFETAGSYIVLVYQTLEFGVSTGWTTLLAGVIQCASLTVLIILYAYIRLQQRAQDANTVSWNCFPRKAPTETLEFESDSDEELGYELSPFDHSPEKKE